MSRPAHEGFLGRGRTGSLGRRLWIPQCACGWRHNGYYQKPAAQRAVDRHLAAEAPPAVEIEQRPCGRGRPHPAHTWWHSSPTTAGDLVQCAGVAELDPQTLADRWG